MQVFHLNITGSYTDGNWETQQIRTCFSRKSNLLSIESWLSERHNCIHLFYDYLNPFKVISHHTNPPRLLWPLLFIVFFLQHNPVLIIPPTIRHMRVNERINGRKAFPFACYTFKNIQGINIDMLLFFSEQAAWWQRTCCCSTWKRSSVESDQSVFGF